MKRTTVLATGCALAFLASPAIAADKAPISAADAAARFGAREAIQDISLSPDGTHVAIVTPTKGHGSALLVADVAKGGDLKPVASASGDPERLRGCSWASDTRLACSIDMTLDGPSARLGFTRMMAVDSDGGHLKTLSGRTGDNALGIMQEGGSIVDWSTGREGSVLMTRQFVPEKTTGTMLASSRQGLGVEVVDTATLARRTVEEPRDGASEYIADGHGTVRIMGLWSRSGTGYLKDRINYFYRRKGSRTWEPLSTLTKVGGGTSEGFYPYAVDPDLDVAYGFERKDGRRALYRVSLDGNLTKELVLERPDVDVSGLIRIGRHQRVVGASYATERRTTNFFDPELARLRTALGKALPGDLRMSFVDASADERRLLVFVGGDTNAGRYYIYDKGTHHLEEVLAARPQLDGLPLAVQTPIRFKASDGTMIPGYLTLPPGSDGHGLPSIVMPHGGPGSRDEWGFDWLSQFFANRGYAVLQPEFRGSTGYGDAWFQKNGFQSWRIAIGDVNDAGRYLLSSGIAAPGKLAIFGWSYGGYAALQSSVLDPDLFKAIVAVAPVTDLETLRGESREFTNFDLVDGFIGHGPEVQRGSPAQNVARIKAPVLMFHGDIDTNVGVGESRLMAARLRNAGKPVEYVEFHHLDHQLDDDAARSELLGKSDAFLRKNLGL